MHIHILGIAGTFMGGIAILAKQLGHRISGMDKNIYPPMSEQLSQLDIDFIANYEVENLPIADLYIIGNTLSRGHACVEEILNKKYPYTSGAQWLGENVLCDKWVIAIAGTHGKTTTAAIINWILEYAGINPSYLIGGVMNNFTNSARLTDSLFFVIEADEYDTAFFDKRSKFIHYCPNTLVINNLEFDHADIFDTLADIQKQFAHLLRIVPHNGLIIYPENEKNIDAVIEKGCWTPVQKTHHPKLTKNGFEIAENKTITWSLIGQHNANNAMMAITIAKHAGITNSIAIEALTAFKGVKNRLEVIYQNSKTTIYNDFAHHPSAIKTTLAGLRKKFGNEYIIALVELRSNTMKQGVHTQTLIDALTDADESYILSHNQQTNNILQPFINGKSINIYTDTKNIIKHLKPKLAKHIVFMSNGDFNNIQTKIIEKV